MGVFYNNYVEQCNKLGKSPSGVALEIGLSKTAVHGWKTGKSKPTDATVLKVADYFGVSVDTLVSEQKENPTVSGEVKNLTPDRYGEFLRELPISELMKLYDEMGEVIKERMGE